VFRAVSGPVLVERTTGPSAAGGDLVSNDYQIVIPTCGPRLTQGR
jgi:hypothetical protein